MPSPDDPHRFSLPVNVCDIRDHHADFGTLVQDEDLLLQFRWMPEIIMIEQGNILTLGLRDPPIPSLSHPGIGLAEIANTIAKFLHNIA